MGWPSYLEDIVDRLTDGLAEVNRERAAPNLPEQRKRDILLEWHARAEKLMREITRTLDIATDPEMDLASEVLTLASRKAELIRENTRLEKAQASITAELAELRIQRDALQGQLKLIGADLKAERKRNKKLQEALDDDQTAALYDLYTPPDKLRRLRKDEDG